MKHYCNNLENHLTAEHNSTQNTNSATADAIVRDDNSGLWYLIVNRYEYSIEIASCPFCGVLLAGYQAL